MAFAHSSVNTMSKVYLANERRYNYTTPKSFLELVRIRLTKMLSSIIIIQLLYFPTSTQISLYTNMLSKKHAELLGMMERLEGGLEKLKSTAAQVDDLKEKLAAQEVS